MNAGLGGVFSAAHQEFAAWYARLWRPLGEITTAVARPAAGERVLDACCGSGASAIPAARAVGPGGTVHGLDLADALLDQGRQEAAALGLRQLRFVNADVLTWQDEPYDVVQCVYGVFFFPDMDDGCRRLIGQLRPGGRFVVCVWLRDGMSRLVPIGRAAALPERPSLADEQNRPDPSARVNTPELMHGWLDSLGLRDITVRQVRFTQPLHPDDGWTFLLGSAMRGFVDGLPDDALDRVRKRFQDGLREAGIDTLDGSSVIGAGYR